ncbi:hypothetical protein HQQ94_08435 [Shewanella sp. VB17]|uniref:hypothetical protein n=1 Tax=Shewanella sp. VB17 TaxID=2739432 RepID=UPI00156449C3|nr:hypothetical protein [Shewanella sp. VB17]NRD73269.1 hypothetical protein [Shewanella sp. VB17]
MSTGVLQSGSQKRVLRGKYNGAPGVVKIPPVDVNKSHVNITSVAWTSSAGSTASPKVTVGSAGSVTVYLRDSTTLEINNKVAYQGGNSSSTKYENVPVFWEIIEG